MHPWIVLQVLTDFVLKESWTMEPWRTVWPTGTSRCVHCPRIWWRTDRCAQLRGCQAVPRREWSWSKFLLEPWISWDIHPLTPLSTSHPTPLYYVNCLYTIMLLLCWKNVKHSVEKISTFASICSCVFNNKVRSWAAAFAEDSAGLVWKMQSYIKSVRSSSPPPRIPSH